MDSYPALYSPTGYGLHDGEAVVRTPHAVKTLQGEATEAIVELLGAMDGETAASDLVAGVPDVSGDDIEHLYEHALAYNAAAIPTGLQGETGEGLLTPVLPTLSPARHATIPDRLAASSVVVFGDSGAITPVLDRLQAAGVAIDNAVAVDDADADAVDDADTAVTDTEPDVILLSEQLERSAAWTEANEQWVAGTDATLIRTRLTETGWRLGPVFTPSAPACLHCLYSRVDANGAGGRLFTETVGGDPPHGRAYVDAVTELLFRTLLGRIPRYLDEQFVVYDHYEQTLRTPRVFALPHCEVCRNG